MQNLKICKARFYLSLNQFCHSHQHDFTTILHSAFDWSGCYNVSHGYCLSCVNSVNKFREKLSIRGFACSVQKWKLCSQSNTKQSGKNLQKRNTGKYRKAYLEKLSHNKEMLRGKELIQPV